MCPRPTFKLSLMRGVNRKKEFYVVLKWALDLCVSLRIRIWERPRNQHIGIRSSATNNKPFAETDPEYRGKPTNFILKRDLCLVCFLICTVQWSKNTSERKLRWILVVSICMSFFVRQREKTEKDGAKNIVQYCI